MCVSLCVCVAVCLGVHCPSLLAPMWGVPVSLGCRWSRPPTLWRRTWAQETRDSPVTTCPLWQREAAIPAVALTRVWAWRTKGSRGPWGLRLPQDPLTSGCWVWG